MHTSVKSAAWAVLASLIGFAPRVRGSDPVTAGIVSANTRFAVDLFERLSQDGGNRVFSPYSVSLVLAMAYDGAEGRTRSEMASVLHFPPTEERVGPAFAALAGRFAAIPPENASLVIANSLWYAQGRALADDYSRRILSDFRANLQPLDFAGQPAASAAVINQWVDRATQGKILNLVGPGSFSAATRAVLCNAVYFKGRWESPFRPARTRPAPFFISPQSSVSVPTMHQSGDFRMGHRGGITLLELPYRGGSLAMDILLPDGASPLGPVEDELKRIDLLAWLADVDAGRPEAVDVSLPRFALAQQLDLASPLVQMGMASAFHATSANFSGMTGKRDLFLSALIQKSRLEVDEAGTEAAAATGAVMTATAVRRERAFQADHPFIFLIRDVANGTILFLGQLVDPR